jgi:hypothetical protein
MFSDIGAGPILIGVAPIAELDFGLRHVLSLLWQSGSVPAR